MYGSSIIAVSIYLLVFCFSYITAGVYPDQHGMIGNNFYDPERKAEFSMLEKNTTQDPAWWGDAEPLWITATKGGLDTALLQWSRSLH